jgi:glutathione S-transferase
MRLFYSAGSPFARIVRIALLETGLDERVAKQEITRARLYSPESEVLALNPIGRVPTLELEDGTILTESKLILDYIDALSPGSALLRRDGSDGWQMLAEMGQASGLLECVVTWMRTLQQAEPQRPNATVERESVRANRAADALEAAVANKAYSGPLNAAQIVLGTGLGLVEPRLPEWKWRERRPCLSDWFSAISARPSFQATMPPQLSP